MCKCPTSQRLVHIPRLSCTSTACNELRLKILFKFPLLNFDWNTVWLDTLSSREEMAVPWTPHPTREVGRAEAANVAKPAMGSSCWTFFFLLVPFWRCHFWNIFSSNLQQVKTDTDASVYLALTLSCFESLASSSKQSPFFFMVPLKKPLGSQSI